MIQFNLLPDVKIQYLKTKRLKRLILLASALGVSVCAIILIVMFSVVLGIQPRTLTNLNDSINKTLNEIKSTEDLEKILTIQNQLTKIDSLHQAKPSVEKMFLYLTQTTPSNISIDSFDVDLVTSKITVKGQAPSVAEMNKYVDTIKFTTVDYGNEEDKSTDKRAFTQVVLVSYSSNDKGTGFSLSFAFEPDIFKSDQTKLKLIVPKITTTRSGTESPAALFKENVTPTGEEEIE